MHILLVRFSSMGDVVLQTATINWLRALYGEKIRLSFLTSKEFVSLLDGHPQVDEVLSFDRRGQEKWKELRKKVADLHQRHPIDLILDLHGTLRSLILRFSFWMIPSISVDKRSWERLFLVKIPSVKLKRLITPKVFGLEPQVERLIKDLEPIFGGQGLAKWKTQEYRQGPHGELTSLKALPKFSVPGPYLVLAPSASFLYKRWPVENFVSLASILLEKTNYHLVVLAGPEDDFCSAFNKISSPRLLNLQGKTSIKESMQLLAHASLSIGNDSGMNHIAEAYGVPCLTLFGPTDPRFGFAPHGSRSAYISKELWCKPCSTDGKRSCFRERHFCMEMISVQEVAFQALRQLEEK